MTSFSTRSMIVLILSLAVATFPGVSIPLLDYQALSEESGYTGIPMYELALITYLQTVPWPIHGLDEIGVLKGRSESSEEVGIFFLLRTLFLALGASCMIALFPRDSSTDSTRPGSLREVLGLPGGVYISLMTVVHIILIPLSSHLHQPTGVYLYAAPYFLPIYFGWVTTLTFLCGITLHLLGLSDSII